MPSTAYVAQTEAKERERKKKRNEEAFGIRHPRSVEEIG